MKRLKDIIPRVLDHLFWKFDYETRAKIFDGAREVKR